MSANTNVALLSPEPASLAQLSDAELLTQTRSLVGRSNRLLAELLAHLGEVEARGIHRTRACASLYTYLTYELRFSEDEAFRRVAAARLVRRFPALLDAIAAGELHLTGLLMLGPHLTEANVVEVMARAKHRTKREIARLVRVLDPLPSVPARIEPLGPALARLVPPAPTCCPEDSGVEATESKSAVRGEAETHAPARVGGDGLGDASAPQRYKVHGHGGVRAARAGGEGASGAPSAASDARGAPTSRDARFRRGTPQAEIRLERTRRWEDGQGRRRRRSRNGIRQRTRITDGRRRQDRGNPVG